MSGAFDRNFEDWGIINSSLTPTHAHSHSLGHTETETCGSQQSSAVALR